MEVTPTSEQNENTMQKAADVSSAIVTALLEACGCPFSLEFVTHSRLLCGSSEREFIYQSNILNTDQMDASALKDLVQLWVDNAPVITVAGASRQVDTYCQVGVSTIGELECVALHPTTPTTLESTEQSTRPSYFTTAIAGGVGGGVGLILLLLVIVGVLYATRRKSGNTGVKQYNRKKTVSSPL